MYKAVILDLDGTLLDTLTDLSDSVNFALKEMSYPARSKDEVRKFIGNGVVMLMSRATPSDTTDEDNEKALKIFRQYYLQNMTKSTKAYDGIIEMLDDLKAANVNTAVVSNKLHEAVVELCEKFFGDRIDVALGVSCEDERKPKPANVFKAMKLLDVGTEEAIYIGDSEVDVQTAINAKLKCIGVTWGFRDADELLIAGADIVADDTADVLAAVLV